MTYFYFYLENVNSNKLKAQWNLEPLMISTWNFLLATINWTDTPNNIIINIADSGGI